VLIIRAVDEISGETAPKQRPPSTAPGEAWNPSAMSSLVLGILAVAIQLVGWAGWLLVVDVTIAPALVSVPVAISAIVFGVKGRNRAREGAPGGRTATIGLKLGVSLIVVTVVGGIVWLSAFASIISHDL
jgi:hypothetical protein